jgi:rRNA maturation RNase YbeY
MPIHIKRRRGIPRFDPQKIRRRAKRLLVLLEAEQSELSLLFTDDTEMTRLNRAYRKKNRTTDVLAFAQGEGRRKGLHPEILGDVVISVPRAKRQARERKIPLMQELTILLVHGVLHLVGHEHERVSPRRRAAMRREQERLVERLTSRAKT